MFGLGTQELIIILLILVLLFGAKKLPELARSIGKSIKEFRDSTRISLDDNEKDDTNDPDSNVKPGKNG